MQQDELVWQSNVVKPSNVLCGHIIDFTYLDTDHYLLHKNKTKMKKEKCIRITLMIEYLTELFLSAKT